MYREKYWEYIEYVKSQMEINQILIFINFDQQDCKGFLLSVL